MIYKLDKESNGKNLVADSIQTGEKDVINVERDPFEQDPVIRENEELGMEFLMDPSKEIESDEEEHQVQEQDSDFENDPYQWN